MPDALNEELSVRVEHDLDDIRVVEGDAELITKGFLKFADKSRMGSRLVHWLLPKLLGQKGWMILDR